MTASTKTRSASETAQLLKKLLNHPQKDERADAARLDELRRVFGQLIAKGEMIFTTAVASKEEESSATEKWNTYLQQQHKTMVSQLCTKIQDNLSIKSSMRTMWGVMASSPMRSNNLRHKHVHPELLHTWFQAVLYLPKLDDKDLVHMIRDEFFGPYLDVQYYARVTIARLATDLFQKQNMQDSHAERLLQLLLMISIPQQDEIVKDKKKYLFPPPDDSNTAESSVVDETQSDDKDESVTDSSSVDDSDETSDEFSQSSNNKAQDENEGKKKRKFAFTRYKSHCKALSNAWLAVLKLPLPPRALKHGLRFLPKHVLSRVPNPLLFADFFMQAYSQQDKNNFTVSLLALDGLFLLQTEHGLEYPKFYASLYRLVQPQMLHSTSTSKHFLELLTKSLVRNEMLPSHVIASFCKRLLRACLQAPPPTILYCLACVENLLRQHPECNCLIHRTSAEKKDVFDADTNDPYESRALESSLWELEALSQHYYAPVALLAQSIGTLEQEDTAMHNLQDFASHTYKSLFVQERKRGGATDNRKKRKPTPLTFVEPKEGLFVESDVFCNILDQS